MTTDYDRLLRLTLELEGLLTLRINRRDTDDATNAARLDEMIHTLLADLTTPHPQATAPQAEVTEAAATPAEPFDGSDNSDGSDSSESSDNFEPSAPSDSSEIAESALEEEAGDADITSATPAEAHIETPAPAETPAEAPIIGEQPAAMSLNERLAREKAVDLTGAFSINDRFRFSRELFRGSQQEMNEAIEALSQMSTAEEAAEYIYDDLCLDPDNEEVKAFMEIITKHF